MSVMQSRHFYGAAAPPRAIPGECSTSSRQLFGVAPCRIQTARSATVRSSCCNQSLTLKRNVHRMIVSRRALQSLACKAAAAESTTDTVDDDTDTDDDTEIDGEYCAPAYVVVDNEKNENFTCLEVSWVGDCRARLMVGGSKMMLADICVHLLRQSIDLIVDTQSS